MEDLKNTIKEIVGYKKELKLKAITDDTILTCATRIFTSQSTQKPTSERPMGKIKDPNSPATEPQIYRLKKMGIKIAKNLTKGEASKLIEENKKKQGEELPDY